MRRFVLQFATLGFLLAPAQTFAQDVDALSGFYVGGFVGGSFLGEQDVDTDSLLLGISVESDTNIDYDPSFRFGGYIGYQLDTSIRVQLDVSYMKTDADNTVEINDNELETEQEMEILSGTAGVFFDLWPISIVVPYVGGGLGVAQIEVENNDNRSVQPDSRFCDRANLPLLLVQHQGKDRQHRRDRWRQRG